MTVSSDFARRFPDLAKSEQALLRASERARRLAEQTGTRLVVRKREQTIAKPMPPDTRANRET